VLREAGIRRLFTLAVRHDRASSLDEHGNELSSEAYLRTL